MLTQVAQTSLKIYHSVVKPKSEDPQSRKILSIMPSQPNWTNKELAQELQMEASTVAARINRLKKLEEVVECGKRACHVTGLTVKIVRLVPSQPYNYELF